MDRTPLDPTRPHLSRWRRGQNALGSVAPCNAVDLGLLFEERDRYEACEHVPRADLLRVFLGLDLGVYPVVEWGQGLTIFLSS